MTQEQYETVTLRLPKPIVEWYRRLDGNLEKNIISDLLALIDAQLEVDP